MMLLSPEKRLRFSRVVIMHNDRPNRHIRFMFEPLVRTLKKGLAKKRTGAAIPDVTTIGIGFQLVRPDPD